jgi:glycerol-3-phosphate acyltransferase PlsY
MMDIREIFFIPLSYLIGCISTGYYYVRLKTGQDIRTMGSGSAGGRNVGRHYGLEGILITGLGDSAKGFIVISIAKMLDMSQWAILGAMIAVVLGHIWPIQLGFKGGKGISATFGSLLCIEYRFLLIAACVALLMLLLTREFTLSGLVAIALTPFIGLFFDFPIEIRIVIFLIAGLILIAHRSNILRIWEMRNKNESQ